MEAKRKKRYLITFLILILGVIAFLLLNICIGTVQIPLSELKNAVMDGDSKLGRIVLDIRAPRSFAAMILGGALALAGYLLQTFFHNPIAGPFVLGISSGAKMVVALVMVFLMGQSISVSSGMMILAAFVGAMISMGFVLLMSRRVSRMSMLVVSGVMIGYICSAITELVVTFAEDSDIVNLHNWSRGSFSGITWSNVGVMTVVVLVSTVIIFLMSKPLEAYQLGDSYAQNLGVNIEGTPHSDGDSLQHTVGVYCCVCRTDLLCRNCGSSSGKGHAEIRKADSDDTGLLPGRERVLYVLRSVGAYDVRADRVKHQYGNSCIWSAGRSVGYGKEE